MNSFRFVVVVAALAFALLVPAQAASKSIMLPAARDTHKLIKSVDEAKSAVVILYMSSKQLHTYHVDVTTVIKVNNVPGKLSDIKPTMLVTDYLERDNDTLDSITVMENPDAARPAAKKKK